MSNFICLWQVLFNTPIYNTAVEICWYLPGYRAQVRPRSIQTKTEIKCQVISEDLGVMLIKCLHLFLDCNDDGIPQTSEGKPNTIKPHCRRYGRSFGGEEQRDSQRAVSYCDIYKPSTSHLKLFVLKCKCWEKTSLLFSFEDFGSLNWRVWKKQKPNLFWNW